MAANSSPSLQVRLLNAVESAGNRLPHPTALFVWMCLFVLLLSYGLSLTSLSVEHPLNGDTITPHNLLSAEGLRQILGNTISNFTGFAPVGSVLVAMLGLGVAEKSGLISALLRLLVTASPRKLITPIVVLCGVLSSLAADAGYVVLIPLAALIFLAAGKHPIAGIAAAFAGVSGGFSANLMIGPIDAILAGISTEAVGLVDANYQVEATSNFYFIIASTFLITAVGTFITEKMIIPRLGDYQPREAEGFQEDTRLTSDETDALRWTGIWFVVLIALLLWITVPESAALRDPETGSLIRSPFISGIVVIIAFVAAVLGVVYGKKVGAFRDQKDIVYAMEDTMQTMAGYLVLMFFAAQFVSYFAWTNLGVIFAVSSANWLSGFEIPTAALVVVFILMAATINLMVGSASAKWAILAPIFVPMLMLLGVSPELTQAAYRVGDSSTNIITPLMPYFALVVAFIERYQPKVGIGTVIALMLPFSLAFLVAWSLMLSLWIGFDLPLGPGAPLTVTPP